MSRDDFSQGVKNTIKQQSHGFCCFTGCAVNCILGGGEVSHICAASPNGPRYNPEQSVKERKSVDNAMMLCRMHAKMVDDHPDHYPADMLRKMKADSLKRIDNKFWKHVSNSLRQQVASERRKKRAATKKVVAMNAQKQKSEIQLRKLQKEHNEVKEMYVAADEFAISVLRQLEWQAKMANITM